MRQSDSPTWPSTIIAADDDAPDGRHVVLTVLSMPELVRRLEALGPRIAASTNCLQLDQQPLLALEVKAGTALPELFRNIDGGDLTFVQRGLTWRPGEARLDEGADVYVLTQTLRAPRWMGAASYAVPPLTDHNTLYYVVVLPAQIEANHMLHLHVSPHEAAIAIPPEVVTHPPHPLLWWGTPPKGHRA